MICESHRHDSPSVVSCAEGDLFWGRLSPCRPGVACALVYFALLAFTLLNLYQGEEDHTAIRNQGPPPLPLPKRGVAVYAGPYFIPLRPSELIEIVFTHWDVWGDRRDSILDALKRFEDSPQNRCSWYVINAFSFSEAQDIGSPI